MIQVNSTSLQENSLQALSGEIEHSISSKTMNSKSDSVSEKQHSQVNSSILEQIQQLFQLTKPRLGSLVLFTMSAGIFLAPTTMPIPHAIVAILATFGIIGASNSFNMYFDRNIDQIMERTKGRPIPAGKLQPKTAILFGVALLGISLPALYFSSNLLTAFLGAFASFLYAGVYTPLKTRTHQAVYIGAIPGGLPMLMGYTAATNQLDGLGLSLFAILLVWQLPHFLSVALNLEEDYRKANVLVYPVAKGAKTTRQHLVLFSFVLWITTLTPLLFSQAGPVYFIVANLLGIYFFVGSFVSLKKACPRFDRKYFLGTLGHLPILLTVLIFDINYSIHGPF